MIPFAGETVTLIHRTETTSSGKHYASYAISTLNGCSWRRTTQMRKDGETRYNGEHITVRVPAGQTAPATGDLLIYGTYTGTVTSDAQFQQIIQAKRPSGGAFVVQSVSDNTMSGAPFPHIKAAGWLA